MVLTERQLMLLRAAWAYAREFEEFAQSMEEATGEDADGLTVLIDEVEAIIYKDA
jgi:hypothetical protein